MTDILFRLAAIAVSAVMLGHSIPRIYLAMKTERGSMHR